MEWTFESGHTSAEFCVRHMMVTNVRGHLPNVRGTLQFDPAHPARSHVSVTIDARQVWTGDRARDAHLRSADFLDADKHPEITFSSDRVELLGAHEYCVYGQLGIRGVKREAPLHVTYLGQWETPWWEDGVDKGPKTRAGFVATARINRHDFGVRWNSPLSNNGVVVGSLVEITIDAEAILSGA